MGIWKNWLWRFPGCTDKGLRILGNIFKTTGSVGISYHRRDLKALLWSFQITKSNQIYEVVSLVPPKPLLPDSFTLFRHDRCSWVAFQGAHSPSGAAWVPTPLLLPLKERCVWLSSSSVPSSQFTVMLCQPLLSCFSSKMTYTAWTWTWNMMLPSGTDWTLSILSLLFSEWSNQKFLTSLHIQTNSKTVRKHF